MKYGINLTWNNLQNDAGALALVRQYLPAMEMLAGQAPGAARIAIRTAASYVWLPLTFIDGNPEIRWHDSWRWEDFV